MRLFFAAMKEELEDEISAIDAIYPGSTEELAPQIFKFTVPSHEDVEVQLSFPEKYPDDKPSIIQVISEGDVNYLQQRFGRKLDEVYREGEVCMFDFLLELEVMIGEGREKEKEKEKQLEKEREKQIEKIEKQIQNLEIEHLIEPREPKINPLEGWIQSEPVVDRGSTFIGFARKVTSLEEAQDYLDLLVSDKKISKAAHNISAWRIKGTGNVQYQDCDDDGEAAAGGRLLHLLTVCKLEFRLKLIILTK